MSNGIMNGSAQKAILVTLGVVVAAGVLGASFAHEGAVQILGFCSLIAVALMGLLQNVRQSVKMDEQAVKTEQVAIKAVEAAKEVKEVKRALLVSNLKAEESTAASQAMASETLAVTKVVHTLVNNDMHVALMANATLARRLAILTGKPEDDALAVEAEKQVERHDARQSVVDKEKGVS